MKTGESEATGLPAPPTTSRTTGNNELTSMTVSLPSTQKDYVREQAAATGCRYAEPSSPDEAGDVVGAVLVDLVRLGTDVGNGG